MLHVKTTLHDAYSGVALGANESHALRSKRIEMRRDVEAKAVHIAITAHMRHAVVIRGNEDDVWTIWGRGEGVKCRKERKQAQVRRDGHRVCQRAGE